MFMGDEVRCYAMHRVCDEQVKIATRKILASHLLSPFHIAPLLFLPFPSSSQNSIRPVSGLLYRNTCTSIRPTIVLHCISAFSYTIPLLYFHFPVPSLLLRLLCVPCLFSSFPLLCLFLFLSLCSLTLFSSLLHCDYPYPSPIVPIPIPMLERKRRMHPNSKNLFINSLSLCLKSSARLGWTRLKWVDVWIEHFICDIWGTRHVRCTRCVHLVRLRAALYCCGGKVLCAMCDGGWKGKEGGSCDCDGGGRWAGEMGKRDGRGSSEVGGMGRGRRWDGT